MEIGFEGSTTKADSQKIFLINYQSQ